MGLNEAIKLQAMMWRHARAARIRGSPVHTVAKIEIGNGQFNWKWLEISRHKGSAAQGGDLSREFRKTE